MQVDYKNLLYPSNNTSLMYWYRSCTYIRVHLRRVQLSGFLGALDKIPVSCLGNFGKRSRAPALLNTCLMISLTGKISIVNADSLRVDFLKDEGLETIAQLEQKIPLIHSESVELSTKSFKLLQLNPELKWVQIEMQPTIKACLWILWVIGGTGDPSTENIRKMT